MLGDLRTGSEPDVKLTGAVRGILGGIGQQGEPLVDFVGNAAGKYVIAISTVIIKAEDIGREIILLFEDGDPARPILVGLVQCPEQKNSRTEPVVNVSLDGRKLTLAAADEISISCGEASITLTRAGKVLIRGAYLLSKSTGPNRIKGGSIQLN